MTSSTEAAQSVLEELRWLGAGDTTNAEYLHPSLPHLSRAEIQAVLEDLVRRGDAGEEDGDFFAVELYYG